MGDGKGEDGMDGVVYTNEPDGEGDEDDDGRRISEPARKRQNTGNSTQGSYSHHRSTYPPINPSNQGSSSQSLRPYYPAQGSQATNVSPKLAPSSISSLHNANQPSAFAQGGMTESPKPISPSQQEHYRLGAHEGSHPRSPNMSQQMHLQNYARGANTARGTPPTLQPPNSNNGPHLPSLAGLTSMAKPGSQSSKGPGSMLQHQPMAAPGTLSQGGSMSSHGGSGSSMREVMGSSLDVWTYVREIEARMARMEKEHNEKIATLQTEITTLRAQLAQQHVSGGVK